MKNCKVILTIFSIILMLFSCSKKCCSLDKNAVAVVQSTSGNNVSGIVHFQQRNNTIKVVAAIQGLMPNQKHGFHIHQYGDISAVDGTKAGGHYNPEGVAHNLPHSQKERHLGDLGNLSANAEGMASLVLLLSNVSLCCAKNSIIGRSVIIHQNEDDGGQPTGNAGPRIAMGVIGISK